MDEIGEKNFQEITDNDFPYVILVGCLHKIKYVSLESLCGALHQLDV